MYLLTSLRLCETLILHPLERQHLKQIFSFTERVFTVILPMETIIPTSQVIKLRLRKVT